MGSALTLIMVGILFGILASFKLGRSLLECYPGLCSFGKVSKDGVPKQKADNTNFEMLLVGEGWKERVDPEKAGMPPNRRVTTTVKGGMLDTEQPVSAWYNRRLLSCKRQQDYQALEVCTAQDMPLRTPLWLPG